MLSTLSAPPEFSSTLASIPEIPEFTISKSRWSTTRQQDVGTTAEYWEENPTTVRVFEDPKFGEHPVVMLRKDAFESLYAAAKHATSDQSSLQLDVEMLFTQTLALDKILESTESQSSFDEGVRELIKAITICAGKIKGTFVIRPVPGPVDPEHLSKEEVAEILADD